MDIEREKKIIILQINALKVKRDKKIDILNAKQRVMNAKRQNVYDEYDAKMKQLEDKLDSLNGRSSEKSHP